MQKKLLPTAGITNPSFDNNFFYRNYDNLFLQILQYKIFDQNCFKYLFVIQLCIQQLPHLDA